MESLEAPVIVYSALTSLLDFFYQIQSLWFIYFDGVCDIKQNDLYWFLPKLVTSIFSSTHKVTSDSFRERGFSNSMEQQKARHDSFTNKKPEIYGSSPGGDLTIVKLVISNIAI